MTATGHGLAHCGIQISQRAPTRAKTKHVGDNAAAAQVYVSSGMRLGIKRCTVSVSDQLGGFFSLFFFGITCIILQIKDTVTIKNRYVI